VFLNKLLNNSLQEEQKGTALARKRLCIAIPASVVSDTPHLREKTSKIGLIGRAAAIFRVDEIVVFPDAPSGSQKTEADVVSTLLSYLETPQYLRKRLFKLNPHLQYAGILPPLRTPHHPLNRRIKALRVGEFREAVTSSRTEKQTCVDIGVEQPALIRGKDLPVGKRVTVRVAKVGKVVEVELANRDEASSYWGYTVTVENSPFGSFVEKRGFDLTVATSRYGSPFSDVSGEIVERWKAANKVLVAFGAPSQGLGDIVKREGRRLSELVDFVVNTVPMQGTETVRTEEALVASLAIFNIILELKR
jgi:predicted SPOUT superfamily RNA methylase MTH1